MSLDALITCIASFKDKPVYNIAMLKIYNTLTNQKQVFKPINPSSVGIYVCGMTVYDFCHMGHARVLVMFDVMTRHMRRTFPKVKYVRNITDIDDKIINRSIENQEDIYTLTNRFIKAMHEDEILSLIHISEPTRPY